MAVGSRKWRVLNMLDVEHCPSALDPLLAIADVVTVPPNERELKKLIPDFDARPVAIVLNRLDTYTLIEAFGRRPRRQPEPVREALARVWISTLCGSEWLGKEASNLVRT